MFKCRLFKKTALGSVDSGAALPRWAGHHLQNCPACRAIYESAAALALELSSTAAKQRQPAPPFARARIMSAIRAQVEAQPRASHGRLGWAVALGMACVAAVGFVWLSQPRFFGQMAMNPGAAPAEPGLNVKLPSVAQVDQWAGTLDAPLEQETQLVLLDATAALNTLARNFLPEDLLASPTETARH